MKAETRAFPASAQTRVPFAIVLAFLAGCADSIGFLEFAQLFMSFMSGNTTRFGAAIALGDWDVAIRVGTTILVFCLGAFMGTLLAAAVGHWRLAVLLGVQATLLGMGLTLPRGPVTFPFHAYPIVFALGLQNAVLQDEEGRSIALTYVTGAVVRFGTGLANMLLGHPASSFWLQAPLWLALTVGAIAGATLHQWYGETAFLVPAVMAAVLAVVSLVLTLVYGDSRYVSSDRAPPPDAAPSAPPTVG
ncbi:MAG: YoaK family protein [Methylobacterium frigidaeris]